jgi:predicted nucleic acid-binding protein
LKTNFEIFIDTDIFLEHLHYDKEVNPDKESFLIKTLKLFTCYTSVVNVSEIFAACESPEMVQKASHAFHGIGVLGIPYRYSLKIGEVLNYIKKKALN